MEGREIDSVLPHTGHNIFFVRVERKKVNFAKQPGKWEPTGRTEGPVIDRFLKISSGKKNLGVLSPRGSSPNLSMCARITM